MSDLLPVLLLQHDIAWEEKPANHATVEAMLSAARPAAQPGVQPGATPLVLLAEMFDTGFSMNLPVIADGRTVPWARELARRHAVHVVCGHAERDDDGRGLNCATLVDPEGRVRGRYEKMHPFMGAEAARFTAGTRVVLRRIDGALACPLVCYDLRFPELWRLAALAGAEVFLIGASWPERRQAHWRSLCIARAIENQAFVVAVNRVGRDPTLTYAGGSLVVGPRGEVLAEAGSEPQSLAATLDLEVLRSWRREFPALGDARPSLLGHVDVDGE